MADWKLDIRLERSLPFDPNRVLPSCIGGSRAAPSEDCAGALDYLKHLDWHRSHLPIDELNIMAEAIRRFLDSDGNRHAIGDLDELRVCNFIVLTAARNLSGFTAYWICAEIRFGSGNDLARRWEGG